MNEFFYPQLTREWSLIHMKMTVLTTFQHFKLGVLEYCYIGEGTKERMVNI